MSLVNNKKMGVYLYIPKHQNIDTNVTPYKPSLRADLPPRRQVRFSSSLHTGSTLKTVLIWKIPKNMCILRNSMFIVSRFQLALRRKQHIRLNLGPMLLILDIALTTPSSANTFAWRHPRPKTRCSAVKNATREIPLTLTQSSLATPHSTSTKGIAKIR